MRIIPVFVKPLFMGTCDACQVSFDPVRGGVCAECRRMLCARHLAGTSLPARIATLFGVMPKRCVECRAGQTPARVA
jgi:hypothetical protein